MTQAESARAFCVMRASRLLGEPYIWGGDDVDEGGFDCSGMVHEVLGQVGRHWPELAIGRTTAAGIMAHFSRQGVDTFRDAARLKPGALVFFHRPGKKIHHVKLHIAAGPFGHLAIDAGGGGSRTKDLRAALRDAACVRISSSTDHGRAEWVALDPFTLLTR